MLGVVPLGLAPCFDSEAIALRRPVVPVINGLVRFLIPRAGLQLCERDSKGVLGIVNIDEHLRFACIEWGDYYPGCLGRLLGGYLPLVAGLLLGLLPCCSPFGAS